MGKKYDAVVATGTYTDRNGAEKKRYKNIGVVMEGNEGGLYMLLDRSFNPAGINSERETIMVSFFAPKTDEARQPTAHDEAKQDGWQPPAAAAVVEDSVPF